jgi:hypothetical protein
MTAPLAPAEPPPAVAAPTAEQPLTQKTMLGMMSPLLANAARPNEGPANETRDASDSSSKPKQTVFGVSEEASAATPIAPSAQAAAPKKPLQLAPTNRTMLGVAPEVVAMAQKHLASASAHTPSAHTPSANMASANMASAAPIAKTASSSGDRDRPLEFTRPSAAPDPAARASRPSIDEGRVSLPSRATRWVALVGAFLVAAGIAAVAFWMMSRGPEIAVRVVSEGGADFLQVDVPGSKSGTKVRFSGAEQPLEAGRARFVLKSDALAVGENQLAIDVVAPDGDVESARVSLQVAYRVRADLGPLASNPPAIDIVVDAKPGSRVTLDGQPLALDAAGHGVRRTVVPSQASTSYTLLTRYRIEGEGNIDGEVRVSLPVTALQIDRPSPDSVTDQDSIEIAGGVSPQATVHVGDLAVGVTEGRFLHRAPLPKEGDYTFDVIARAPGQAPHQVPLRVRRVHDMTMAAASFEADKTLTYARIAQNPVIYRGQKVALDGRVYNVEVQGGRSVLQLLVRDCPGAQRCSLWVEYGQATDATVDTWVRVLGTVAGEQQFRSKQGIVQAVPSVNAQYVLRLAR